MTETFLVIYIVIGIALDIMYQIDCVKDHVERIEELMRRHVNRKLPIEYYFELYKFDYLGTICRGYHMMLFWPYGVYLHYFKHR